MLRSVQCDGCQAFFRNRNRLEAHQQRSTTCISSTNFRADVELDLLDVLVLNERTGQDNSQARLSQDLISQHSIPDNLVQEYASLQLDISTNTDLSLDSLSNNNSPESNSQIETLQEGSLQASQSLEIRERNIISRVGMYFIQPFVWIFKASSLSLYIVLYAVRAVIFTLLALVLLLKNTTKITSKTLFFSSQFLFTLSIGIIYYLCSSEKASENIRFYSVSKSIYDL
ncbi:MAG: hypothetical protein EXX96DRAFT_565102 [Benjaminiella poitrasii]|nr:MAG: hypothetical protein EXX96DRAFT_565102 [Benjaminiella poitrasii]